MNAATVLLIAAAAGWILVRQVRRAPVSVRALVAAPLALGFFGIRAVPAVQWHTPTDAVMLAAGVVVSVALGVRRGQTIAVWREPDGTCWRQGCRATLLLWGALAVARGAQLAVAVATGHPEAAGLGAVLLTLAAGFAAQNAVVGARVTRDPSRPFARA